MGIDEQAARGGEGHCAGLRSRCLLDERLAQGAQPSFDGGRPTRVPRHLRDEVVDDARQPRQHRQ
jgi:hypothetical protein